MVLTGLCSPPKFSPKNEIRSQLSTVLYLVTQSRAYLLASAVAAAMGSTSGSTGGATVPTLTFLALRAAFLEYVKNTYVTQQRMTTVVSRLPRKYTMAITDDGRRTEEVAAVFVEPCFSMGWAERGHKEKQEGYSWSLPQPRFLFGYIW